MSTITLTDARVRALRPRTSTYHLRDAKLRGFGLRVLPSGGKRFFLHTQHRGQRVWRIVGDANAMPVADARVRATSMLATIRGDAPAQAPPFESVAEAVFRRYAQVWKPQTLYVNRSYYRCTLLPWFGGRSIAGIDGADVERWFASLRGTPVPADRSMPVLSVILTEAERMGHRPEGSNPCRGIRRYRRTGRERSLSDAEIRRLAETLSAHEEMPSEVGRPIYLDRVALDFPELVIVAGHIGCPWTDDGVAHPGPDQGLVSEVGIADDELVPELPFARLAHDGAQVERADLV